MSQLQNRIGVIVKMKKKKEMKKREKNWGGGGGGVGEMCTKNGGDQVRCVRRSGAFVKIQETKFKYIYIYLFFFFWGGGGQVGCERRIKLLLRGGGPIRGWGGGGWG